MTREVEISGWGRWPRRRCRLGRLDPEGVDSAAASAIARGLGRAYGDSALNPRLTLQSGSLDRLLGFDADGGILTAEAGASLAGILEVFVPRGWFPAVTPGTRFVTVGGLIAADAHGKNHHVAGSFGDQVLWLDLLCADGATRRCTPHDDAELFNATIGGMGLTGHILRAAFRLKRIESAWIQQETVVAPDLDAAIAAFEAHLDRTYSVAWIDCMATGAARGRSLVHLGEHVPRAALDARRAAAPFALPARRSRRVPLDAPSWLLNRLTVRLFNRLYYRRGARGPRDTILGWDDYFYPLDAVLDWNRIYGRRGFAQYQSALPLAGARRGLERTLDAIAASGLGSFLAVLKRFGPGAPARPLSFPIEGYTLALDFPLSPAALTLMDRLDEITLEHGGRLYLAKDSRMTQATLEAGYGPAIDAFRRLRAATGAAGRFHSLQSRRLGL